MKNGERYFLDLVRDGTLTIDDEGRIWRHFWIHPFGGKTKLPEPRRAEENERYLRLSTMRSGKSIRASAHRVVYIYFFGDVIDGLEVDHVDFRKHNNRPSNLQPVSRQENAQRASENGLYRVSHHVTKSRRGENSGRNVLTWEKVREIRRLAEQHTQRELAEMFGVTRANISAIVVRRSWQE